MTYCKEKYTGHGTVWHNARWNTLVVVPHNTMPGEIHGLWYRITHCQVKYSGYGTALHIASWNALVVVPFDILLGCTGRGTAWHISRCETLVVIPYDTLLCEIHWSWYRMTHFSTYHDGSEYKISTNSETIKVFDNIHALCRSEMQDYLLLSD